MVIADHHADIDALVANLDECRHHEARVISGTIAPGDRHNTLISLAGTMWRRGCRRSYRSRLASDQSEAMRSAAFCRARSPDRGEHAEVGTMKA
jgi:hypothetical protein